jgi:hypothetical protein
MQKRAGNYLQIEDHAFCSVVLNSTIKLDSLNRQATLREERLRERYDSEHVCCGSWVGGGWSRNHKKMWTSSNTLSILSLPRINLQFCLMNIS